MWFLVLPISHTLKINLLCIITAAILYQTLKLDGGVVRVHGDPVSKWTSAVATL